MSDDLEAAVECYIVKRDFRPPSGTKASDAMALVVAESEARRAFKAGVEWEQDAAKHRRKDKEAVTSIRADVPEPQDRIEFDNGSSIAVEQSDEPMRGVATDDAVRRGLDGRYYADDDR